MNLELVPKLDDLIAQLSQWKGFELVIMEQITRVPGNLNRHFTTQSTARFYLESVGITTSGANLSLLGQLAERECSYQVACDLLEALTIETEQIILVEAFGDVAQRHTSIKVCSTSNQSA